MIWTCLMLMLMLGIPPVEADNPTSEPPLTGKTFSVARLADAAVTGPEITVRLLEGGILTGHDGCNSFRGSYTLENDSLSISENFVSTQAACPDHLATRSASFLAALSKTASFKIEETTLELNDIDETAIMRLEQQSSDLSGTSWTALSYNNGKQAVVSVLAGTTITATFGDDGELTGNASCNRYFTSFEIDGERISVGPTGASRRYCAEPEGLMDQEMLFLAALGNASNFRLTGDRLDLRNDAGSLLVTFLVAEE